MLAEALNTESVDWFTKKPLVLPEMWKTLSSRVTIYMVRRERDYAKVHQIAYQLTVRSGRVVGCHLHAADGVLLLLGIVHEHQTFAFLNGLAGLFHADGALGFNPDALRM